MDALETIFTRKSVRNYKDTPLTDEEVHTILRAGMSGPSCTNARDWSFIVVTDREKLDAMAEANGRPAHPLNKAVMAVLICGDLDRAFKRAPEYWVIDGAIAGENMALAAHAMGIGCVWLGTWPQMDRVERQAALFDLPENVTPHSVLAFGYPEDGEEFAERDLYEEDRVHFEKW